MWCSGPVRDVAHRACRWARPSRRVDKTADSSRQRELNLTHLPTGQQEPFGYEAVALTASSEKTYRLRQTAWGARANVRRYAQRGADNC
jgi:hypothetical protein